MDSVGIDRYIVARAMPMASIGASRRFMHQNLSALDPRKYLKEATQAMSEICVVRYETFGTAGNVSKLRSLDLAEIAKRYDSGGLDPRVN